ncbi:hypothetical protein F4604DRAFT_1577611 [Suillus subluteus]|nr:hypothetical protein F4604DRAFT_1577611 [Suillus subluteus]
MTPVTPPTRGLVLPCPTSPSKASFSYKMTLGSEVSDDTLKLCANLFSSNYGIWGDQAATISKFTVAGQETGQNDWCQTMIPVFVYLESSVLVTCYIQVDPLESERPQLYGHAFAMVWDYGENKVGWVTQLVVDEAVRQRYITTHLLQTLKCHALFSHVNVVGLISSHPTACNALAKYAGETLNWTSSVNMQRAFWHLPPSSPISYLKAAQLRGSLFQDSCDNGAISSVFTEFYVDHTEPLAVLEQYKKKGQWCLGELLDGHEFLTVFPIAPMSPVCDDN